MLTVYYRALPYHYSFPTVAAIIHSPSMVLIAWLYRSEINCSQKNMSELTHFYIWHIMYSTSLPQSTIEKTSDMRVL